MKPEAQRIAIAEFCGWQWYQVPKAMRHERYRFLFLPAFHEYPEQSPAWLVKADGTERICNWDYMEREGCVPDYLNDLNAMHEAEKLCRLKDDYRRNLEFVVGRAHAMVDTLEVYCATAAQRAQALLRTIGGWTDEP